jgi:1-deoxy-D-xylulose-5-phosphate synthase
LSLGTLLEDCEKAADRLEAEGLSVTVADARFAKPLDTDLIAELAASHSVLITTEQGSMGGFGAMVLQAMASQGLLDRGLKVRNLHLPDRFINQASPDEMYAEAGLDVPNMVETALSALRRDAKVVDLKTAG